MAVIRDRREVLEEQLAALEARRASTDNPSSTEGVLRPLNRLGSPSRPDCEALPLPKGIELAMGCDACSLKEELAATVIRKREAFPDPAVA